MFDSLKSLGIAACVSPPVLALALALAPAAQGVHAAPLKFSSQGTFDAQVASTPFSAPNASWSLSFVVDSEPSPLTNDSLTATGLFTTIPFSDFSLLLNGVATGAVPFYVSLYNAGNGGGMDIFFTDQTLPGPVDALSFYTAQLYTGNEFSPTVQPGTYASGHPTLGGLLVYDDSVYTIQGNPVVTIAALSLPGSAGLALAALALMGFGRKRQMS